MGSYSLAALGTNKKDPAPVSTTIVTKVFMVIDDSPTRTSHAPLGVIADRTTAIVGHTNRSRTNATEKDSLVNHRKKV